MNVPSCRRIVDPPKEIIAAIIAVTVSPGLGGRLARAAINGPCGSKPDLSRARRYAIRRSRSSRAFILPALGSGSSPTVNQDHRDRGRLELPACSDIPRSQEGDNETFET